MMKILRFSPKGQKRLSTNALRSFAELNRAYLNNFANKEEQKQKQLERSTIIRLIKVAYYRATRQNTIDAPITWHIPGSVRSKHQTLPCAPYNLLRIEEEEEEEREGPENDPFFDPPVPKELCVPKKRKITEVLSEDGSEGNLEDGSEEEPESEAESVASDDEAEDPFRFDDD